MPVKDSSRPREVSQSQRARQEPDRVKATDQEEPKSCSQSPESGGWSRKGCRCCRLYDKQESREEEKVGASTTMQDSFHRGQVHALPHFSEK